MSALPIKMIIHVEHVDITKANPLTVHRFHKDRVLGTGATRKNPACVRTCCIVRLYFRKESAGNLMVDLLRTCDDPQLDLRFNMIRQLFRRNPTPTKQFLRAFVGEHKPSCFATSKEEAPHTLPPRPMGGGRAPGYSDGWANGSPGLSHRLSIESALWKPIDE